MVTTYLYRTEISVAIVCGVHPRAEFRLCGVVCIRFRSIWEKVIG